MAKKSEGDRFVRPDGHPRDLIIIHQTPEIPKEGVFLSLNGFPFLAKPGVAIPIPRPVRQMIDTLIYTDIIQQDGVEIKRDRPRYTYTLVMEDVDEKGRPVDPEKLATFLASEKAKTDAKKKFAEDQRE